MSFEIISGESFYDIGDFIFSTSFVENSEDYNKIANTFNIDKLDEVNVVYLHAMYKNQFFDVIKDLSQKFVVITHNSDININDISNLPNNVIKWFSQNVDIKDDRIESLPIGLENKKWFPHLRKKEKMVNKVKENKNIKNLLYINHNVNTFKSDRLEPYQIFNNKWTTIERGSNGYNFDHYLDNIYNHKFVLSPRGNGIDTHRKWEALYLNTIPIEKRCINNTFYEDLPICFVDNWNEVTEDFLNREYDRIINSEWNMKKLKISYWKNIILNWKNKSTNENK